MRHDEADRGLGPIPSLPGSLRAKGRGSLCLPSLCLPRYVSVPINEGAAARPAAHLSKTANLHK